MKLEKSIKNEIANSIKNSIYDSVYFPMSESVYWSVLDLLTTPVFNSTRHSL